MTGNGITQIVIYARRADAARVPARRLHGARVHRHPPHSAPARRARACLLPAARDARGRGADLEGLRRHGARLHGPLLGAALPAAAAAGSPAAEPGQPGRGLAAHRDQHDRELRHEHELAVLRRRDDDVVPEPDGRPDGAELRLGRARDGRPRGGDPRLRAPLGDDGRQLLGRSLPVARVHPGAARADPRGSARLAGRRADVRRGRHRDHAGERRAVDRARPGCDADRDQAARHERGRVLQLELVRAVREPDRLHELPRDARDPAHPGGAGVHVRPHGERQAPGLADLRRDVRDVRDRRCDRAALRAARLAGAARLRGEHHRRRRLERREHGRQGGSLRHRRDLELGGRDDERLERLRQRRPRRAHRRPAAPSRS